MVMSSNDPQLRLPDLTLQQDYPRGHLRRVYRRVLINEMPNVNNEIVEDEDDEMPKADVQNLISWILTSVGITLVLAYMVDQYPMGERNIFADQYNQIVYSCGKDFNVPAIMNQIRQNNYLHQFEALEQLEDALESKKRYNAFAFVGPPGVGKTLLANQLAEYFPWPNNVYKYNWKTEVGDEVEKMHALRMLLDHIYDCGVSLLIIDNLAPCEHGLLSGVESLAHEVIGINRFQNLKARLIVIYIFTLNVMEGEHIYWAQHKILQHLPDTVTINFDKFGLKELKDCVWREVDYANMTLTFDKFQEIVNEINVETSGCKNVRVKVLTYGNPN